MFPFNLNSMFSLRKYFQIVDKSADYLIIINLFPLTLRLGSVNSMRIELAIGRNNNGQVSLKIDIRYIREHFEQVPTDIFIPICW